MLVQDELASVLVDTPQHTGLQGCCPLSAGPEWCFVLSGFGSCLGKSKAGAALDTLPGLRRGVVAGSEPQGTSQLDCPQQELPEHTAAHHHVMSWLALSFCFCLRAVMAWDSGRLVSPKLGARFASL